MARAKGSPRVWEPVSKEGHGLRCTRVLLWRLPALATAAVTRHARCAGHFVTSMHRPCPSVTGKASASWSATAADAVSFYRLCKEVHLSSGCVHCPFVIRLWHKAGERGKRWKCWVIHPRFCPCGLRAVPTCIAPLVWGFWNCWYFTGVDHLEL